MTQQSKVRLTRLKPGVYVDESGALHLSVPELLEANGWPDNEHNRQMVTEAAARVLGEQIPGATLVVVEDALESAAILEKPH